MDPSIATLKQVFHLAVPEAVLVLFACVLFIGGTVRTSRTLWGIVALVGIGVAGWFSFSTPPAGLVPTVSALWPDSFAVMVRGLALIGGAILVLASLPELPDDHAADYLACLLAVTAGVSLTGSANELVTLFLTLELISIPTYVMLYLPKSGRAAQEAAVKYFLLSVFSSALLLFGFSYLYGVTGTTNITAIHQALTEPPQRLPAILLMAVVMVVAGLGFRITAVPFHFYAPDVYQGAPTCAAALLAVVPKIAGFAALVRLTGFIGADPAHNVLATNPRVQLLFWMLAAATMTVGNVLALWQNNLKRMLAYSSVAHAGYMLIGIAVATVIFHDPAAPSGVAAVLFYLAAYGAMTIGAFAVAGLLRAESIDDLAGIGRTHPGVAALMALFLFSLIGLPLTAGFMGKWLLFFSALAAPGQLSHPETGKILRVLALIGAINAAIGAYYYLRVIGVIYLRVALNPPAPVRSVAGWSCLAICAGLTVWLGCYPAPMVNLARKAAQPFGPQVVAGFPRD